MFGITVNVKMAETESYDVQKAAKAAAAEKKAKEEEHKKEEQKNIKHTLLGDVPIYIDTAKTVFGKAIREKPMPIADLMFDTGVATVWGDVINFELNDTKRGVYKILTFDITDYTSSVTVKVFDNKDVVDSIAAKIENAKTLIVKGAYKADKFTNEYMITPDSQ